MTGLDTLPYRPRPAYGDDARAGGQPVLARGERPRQETGPVEFPPFCSDEVQLQPGMQGRHDEARVEQRQRQKWALRDGLKQLREATQAPVAERVAAGARLLDVALNRDEGQLHGRQREELLQATFTGHGELGGVADTIVQEFQAAVGDTQRYRQLSHQALLKLEMLEYLGRQDPALDERVGHELERLGLFAEPPPAAGLKSRLAQAYKLRHARAGLAELARDPSCWARRGESLLTELDAISDRATREGLEAEFKCLQTSCLLEGLAHTRRLLARTASLRETGQAYQHIQRADGLDEVAAGRLNQLWDLAGDLGGASQLFASVQAGAQNQLEWDQTLQRVGYLSQLLQPSSVQPTYQALQSRMAIGKTWEQALGNVLRAQALGGARADAPVALAMDSNGCMLRVGAVRLRCRSN